MTEARTALVTGAATGLGRATALALGRAGFDLALADLDADWLREVAAHPDLRGRKAVALALDLRAEDSIAQAMAQAAEALGVIDVLVNNAGVPLQRPATEVTWAEWDAVIDVNLKGSYFLATAFARHCRAGGRGGAVISIASTHGLTGIADRSVYGISKGGIIQMTRMLAIEWAPLGIRVTHAGAHPDRAVSGSGRDRGGGVLSGERRRPIDHRPHLGDRRRPDSDVITRRPPPCRSPRSPAASLHRPSAASSAC